MKHELRSGLRTLFGIHMVAGFLFGLGYMFMPEQIGAWLNWNMADPVWRVLGAALFSLGFSSMMALGAHEWKEVKLLVELEVVWPALGALFIAYSALAGAIPPVAWFIVALLAIFAVGFAFYLFTAPSVVSDQSQRPGGVGMLQH